MFYKSISRSFIWLSILLLSCSFPISEGQNCEKIKEVISIESSNDATLALFLELFELRKKPRKLRIQDLLGRLQKCKIRALKITNIADKYVLLKEVITDYIGLRKFDEIVNVLNEVKPFWIKANLIIFIASANSDIFLLSERDKDVEDLFKKLVKIVDSTNKGVGCPQLKNPYEAIANWYMRNGFWLETLEIALNTTSQLECSSILYKFRQSIPGVFYFVVNEKLNFLLLKNEGICVKNEEIRRAKLLWGKSLLGYSSDDRISDLIEIKRFYQQNGMVEQVSWFERRIQLGAMPDTIAVDDVFFFCYEDYKGLTEINELSLPSFSQLIDQINQSLDANDLDEAVKKTKKFYSKEHKALKLLSIQEYFCGK